jgi:DNA-binding NarL/FixJ family response regulator
MRMEAPIDDSPDEAGAATVLHPRFRSPLTDGRVRIDRGYRSSLTPDELVALCAAANGFTASETARALHRGTQTIKTRRGQALLKLGARNMPHAVRLAMTSGILYRVPAAAAGEQRLPERLAA